MFIREVLPSEASEVVSFHWSSLLASHDGPGPKLGPPSLWARPEVREYYGSLRLKGVHDKSIKSLAAFSGFEEGKGEGEPEAQSQGQGQGRGEIIGHVDLGPPGGFSPLTDVCKLELLSVYCPGRGKGVARQIIKYGLQRAVADGSMKLKPKSKEGQVSTDDAATATSAIEGAAVSQPANSTTPKPSEAKKPLGVITIKENVAARNFYTKLGGQFSGEYPIILFGVTITCVAFTWDLDGVEALLS